MSDAPREGPQVDHPALELLSRLEQRAHRLRNEGYFFLVMIVSLLGFGALVVFQAPQITNRDVGADTDSRLTSTYDEIARLNARNAEISNEFAVIAKSCSVYTNFFKQWPNQSQDDHQWHQINMLGGALPSGKELADKIGQTLSQKELDEVKTVGVQITLPAPCDPFFISEPRETFKTILEATSQHEFHIDREKAASMSTELGKNVQRREFLLAVATALYNKEVADAANGNTSSDKSNISDDDKGQLIRLIQTSITRFGTLIVVSFLVAILIPSYRYNVRLSAFYSARADALIAMRSNSIKNSEFDVLTAVLTPHIEFGKSPRDTSGAGCRSH